MNSRVDGSRSIWQERPKSQHFYSQNTNGNAFPPISSSSSSAASLIASSPNSSLYLPIQTDQGPATTVIPDSSQNNSFRSRARAGTLPSRLSPGLIGNRAIANQAGPSNSSSSLGSLALLGPSPNDSSPIDSPTIKPQISHKSSSSSVSVSIYEDHHQLAQFPQVSQRTSITAHTIGSLGPIASVSTSALTNTSNGGGNTSVNTSGSANSPTSRLRSGSLNLLPENKPSFSPFGPSIWASSSLEAPKNENKRLSINNSFDDKIVTNPGSSTSATNRVDNIDSQPDPMQPFLNELAVRTDVNRLRSYTVTTPAYPFEVEDDGVDNDVYYQQNSYQREDQFQQIQQPQFQQQQQQQHQQPPQQLSQQYQQYQQNQSSQLPTSLAGRLHLHNLLSPNRPRAQTVAVGFDHAGTGQFSRFKPQPPQVLLRQQQIQEQQQQQQQQLQQQQQQQQQQQMQQQQQQQQPQRQQHQHHVQQPPLQYQQPQTDHIDNSNLNNSFEDSSGPTRSLWLGNLPPSTTSYTLQAIFSGYGTIESARVLTHKQCGFINFTSVESAVQARAVLNGKELFPGSGPCRIGYAKVMISTQPSGHSRSQSNSPELVDSNGLATGSEVEYSVIDRESANNSNNNAIAMIHSPKDLSEIAGDMAEIVSNLGADSVECRETSASIERALNFTNFKPEIPPVNEPKTDRIYDAPALREVRKKVDSGTCSQQEIDEIAIDLLNEIADLSSDYVGNTVVQKLFDSCSECVKDLMLAQIAPYLAQIGVHKNGTWAAQKIIDVAGTKRQVNTICEALRPYTVHLFLDQFGNYVIQCCLKFGGPWNDFIFETMLSQFWAIAQGRFGARAMRACLESHYISRQQQRMLASAITLHAVQLATNTNGALLLTWFLDTCTLPNRHVILAPRLIPDIAALCTHKLASLTVLKVVNYKAESGARQLLFDNLFNTDDDRILEEIISDPSHGASFIYKIVSAPLLLEGQERQNALNKIRKILIANKALPSQGYKRLMDEVGISTRSNGASGSASNSNGNGNSSYQQSPTKRRAGLNSTNNGRPIPAIHQKLQPQQYYPQMVAKPQNQQPQQIMSHPIYNDGGIYGYDSYQEQVPPVVYDNNLTGFNQQFEHLMLGNNPQQYQYPVDGGLPGDPSPGAGPVPIPQYFTKPSGYMPPPPPQGILNNNIGYVPSPIYEQHNVRRDI